MAIVSYNGKAIIPAPFVDIRRNIVRNEAGRPIRVFYDISVKGEITVDKGSPNSSGVFWTQPGYPPNESIADASRLGALSAKMGALNQLFCQEGQWFQIQSLDGSAPIKFQPFITTVDDTGEGRIRWYNTVNYTISMTANTVLFGTQQSCDGLNTLYPDEQWNIEAADQIKRTYRLTHSVSSQQKNLFDPNTGQVLDGNAGWQRAQSVVLGYLGLQTSMLQASGVVNLIGWQAYNYFRAQQIDEAGGKFAVTETWLVYDSKQGGQTALPPALDDYTVNSRLTQEGLTEVSIDGTVTGLEVSDNTIGTVQQTRWQNAQSYYNTVLANSILSRASSYAGVNLNPTPVTTAIGRNPVQGVITWSAQYNNRRLPLVPGAISETVSIAARGGEDVFASIPVLGRPWGPVLQSIGTITERSSTISVSANMPSATMDNPAPAAPSTDGIIISLAPVAQQVFRQRDETSWVAEHGTYSRSVTFVYQ